MPTLSFYPLTLHMLVTSLFNPYIFLGVPRVFMVSLIHVLVAYPSFVDTYMLYLVWCTPLTRIYTCWCLFDARIPPSFCSDLFVPTYFQLLTYESLRPVGWHMHYYDLMALYAWLPFFIYASLLLCPCSYMFCVSAHSCVYGHIDAYIS